MTMDNVVFPPENSRPEMAWLANNAWSTLGAFTPARIGLGRAGCSLPTHVNLQFQLDHARARDAVWASLEVPTLVGQLQTTGLSVQQVRSLAPNRAVYLQRPDLGRQLHPDDAMRLREQGPSADIAVLVADGLSSLAVMRHAVPFLQHWLPLVLPSHSVTTICVAEQGRVALGDEVGEALRARLVLVLVGERPGLSSPDSLGLYLTWRPRRGCTDADRNCVSNVRPEGLAYVAAAQTCAYLVKNALRLGGSGVSLKDHSRVLTEAVSTAIPFLNPRA